MFLPHLSAAFRTLRSKKGFTVVNIVGLSVGIAACLLIVLYVVDELRYDRYNLQADRIFRITENVRLNGHDGSYAGTPKPLKDEFASLPDIEHATRLIPVSSLFLSPKKFFVTKGQEVLEERKVVYAESDLFDVFTLPVVEGSAANALTDPFTAVVTERAARKYFNRVDVVGETLVVNDSSLYKITAVIKDIPSQSHFNFDLFLSYASIPESKSNGWGYSGIHNYVVVKPGGSVARIEEAIRSIELKHTPVFAADGNSLAVVLMPLLDIHLRSVSQYELEKTGNIQFVYACLAIAFLILLVACVNFVNLSTARSANRAKEIGVRKVLGSSRGSLIRQFLSESLLVAFVSAAVAVVFMLFTLPWFNQLTDKDLSLSGSLLLWFVPALLLIVLLVGCLAGIYPALYLSAFRPILVLKGRLAAGFKGGFLRSSLVVFQFSVCIFLLISTLVVYNQLSYIHRKDLGFDKSQQLVIKNTHLLGNNADVFKRELQQLQGVESVSMSRYLPTGKERLITGLFPQLPIDIKQDVLSEFWTVDEDYLKTVGLQLTQGRNFSRQLASDSAAIIVNEAFVKQFGFKDPLEKIIYRASFGVQPYHIVGVVKDFNFSSLRNVVGPLALVYQHDNGAVTARINSADMATLMAQVEDSWKRLSNNIQFSFSFMDEDFEAIYRSEQRMQQLFVAFSVLAILIACLGLFSLASYAAEQRSKEIAIRKVIGATSLTIVNMLSTDFLKLVALSILIASPVGWFVMNRWLQDFSYRIDIGFFIFVIAGAVALLVALLTVSFQAIRAALANPVRSLRAE